MCYLGEEFVILLYSNHDLLFYVCIEYTFIHKIHRLTQTDSNTQTDTHTNTYNIACDNYTYICNKREVVISITKPSSLQAKVMTGLARNVHQCNDNKTIIILVNYFLTKFFSSSAHSNTFLQESNKKNCKTLRQIK